MSPDARFAAALDAFRRRFRTASLSSVAAAAAAASVGAMVVLAVAGVAPSTVRVVGSLVFAGLALGLGVRRWRLWTPARTARVVEARTGTADNLVITAEEVAGGRAPVPHPIVRAELMTAAMARLDVLSPERVQPLKGPLLLAAGSVCAVLLMLVMWPGVPVTRSMPPEDVTSSPAQPIGPGDLRVVITPPGYTRRAVEQFVNPTEVVALVGSRIRLEVAAGRVSLVTADGGETPFERGDTVSFLDMPAAESQPLVVRNADAAPSEADRLLYVRVQPDNSPAVRIREPGRDLMFSTSDGEVPIHIEASDDVGLRSLALRYTRVSGSGETFTFEEGEWPIRIERRSDGEWEARTVLSLPTLKLEDGDTLVYRAVASDSRPGAEPSSSETFLIEVGRLAGVASTGFALPEDRDRHAISQQMLIIKTERLLATRDSISPEEFADQSRLLAIEQRRVRAEFVFMTGGEVEDEVEEAAHSHELAEGRFENEGQAELLAAIREMSRAEQRLNAVEVEEGLEFERAALRALQRAFDRRRYLLRTLPERTRIDPSRRLTGDLDQAQSSSMAAREANEDPVLAGARAVLTELGGADLERDAARLASRVIAVDPASDELRRAALRLSGARDAAAQREAARQIEQLLIELLQRRAGSSGSTPLPRDPLAGRVAEEVPPGPKGSR